MKQPHHSKPRKLFAGVYRFSVAGFLVALVFALVVMPFLQHLERVGEMVESALLTLVLISAVMAVGHKRRTLVIAACLVTPAIVCRWLSHLPQELPQRNMFEEIFLAFALLFVLFVIFQLLQFILRAPLVDSEVLCAGVSTYLLLGLLWSFAYKLVGLLDHGAFVFVTGPDAAHESMSGVTSIYFSFITLSTVGYGDITPAHNVARMLAASEAMTGTLFLAVLISRLVSLYSSQALKQPAKESSDKE